MAPQPNFVSTRCNLKLWLKFVFDFARRRAIGFTFDPRPIRLASLSFRRFDWTACGIHAYISDTKADD